MLVEFGRIELVWGVQPQPFQLGFVVGVGGIGECREQFLVAPDTTAVLRWGGALATGAAWIDRAWLVLVQFLTRIS